jgi:signal transduction histidine kinase
VAKIYNEQQKSTDLKSTLEKISDASGEMISEISDTVWAINPRNDNMETMLQRMESFAKPLLAAKEIKFHFEYDKNITQLNLEMTKRKNFYLIFKEAVNNALKLQKFICIDYIKKSSPSIEDKRRWQRI